MIPNLKYDINLGSLYISNLPKKIMINSDHALLDHVAGKGVHVLMADISRGGAKILVQRGQS